MFGKLSRGTRKRLEAGGHRAPATVLAIADRGMTVTHGSEGFVGNTEVILKTHLRVEPEGRLPFEVEDKFRYPQMSIPSAGSRLSVLYDPEDHEHVLIEDRPPVVDFNGGTLDLGAMLDTIKQTKAEHPGDRMAMADALKQQMGIPAMVIGGGAPDHVGQLERLAALHAGGALTDAEFAAEKAKVLAG